MKFDIQTILIIWGLYKFNAIWIVYKFGYTIFNKTDIPDTEEIHGEYKSYKEAEYKTAKKLNIEESGREVQHEQWEDKDGSPYFVFHVISEIMVWILVPHKYD
jgi:hypothetical protein